MMKPQDIVIIIEGSKRYLNQKGQIVRANNITSYSPSTGVEKVTLAWDVRVNGETIRFEESKLQIAQSVSATSQKALVLAAIWGGAKWNGRLYGNKIFVNNEEIILNPDLVSLIQMKPTPQQMGCTLMKTYSDISSNYGERESEFCTVYEWKLGNEIIKQAVHHF